MHLKQDVLDLLKIGTNADLEHSLYEIVER